MISKSSVQYRIIEFYLQFSEPLTFYSFPPFIFRSVLGKELKKMACIMRTNRCESCSLRYTCAYSLIFETPIHKDNSVLPGRNRAGHPFTISSSLDIGDKAEKMVLRLTVFGPAMEYFPYLYYAILRAGENGLFKERVPFTINDVQTNGGSILTNAGDVEVERGTCEWSLPLLSNTEESELETVTERKEGEGKLHIKLMSPLRMKIDGKYKSTFNAVEFFNTVWSRVRIVCGFYGNLDESEECNLPDGLKMENMNLQWRELERWSSRQKTKMKMGGIVGSFDLFGNFGQQVYSLLQFAEIFHTGKNTAFGLGEVKVDME